MPALQVRDLPQDIYDKLAREAAAEHRSLAQQTTAILDQHFQMLEGGLLPSVSVFPSAAARRLMDEARDAEERIERRKRVFARIEELNRGIVWPDEETCQRLFEEAREERR